MAYNDLINTSGCSNEQLVERIENLRYKIGRAAEVGYANMAMIDALRDAEQQLLDEFHLRMATEEGAKPPPVEVLTVGGPDDSGLVRQRERREKRRRSHEAKPKWRSGVGESRPAEPDPGRTADTD